MSRGFKMDPGGHKGKGIYACLHRVEPWTFALGQSCELGQTADIPTTQIKHLL